ncbi:MAG TPA: hypothetical protein VJ964_10740 [Balneolaceae bacterium]|nr:hypothetical protein [Balneolaceae bacterium]
MNILLGMLLTVFISFSGVKNAPYPPDDSSHVFLNAYLPEQVEQLSPIVRANLKNKLNQITALNGVSGSMINQRFIITANINVLSKDIIPTAPPQHVYTIEVSFYIGDGIDGKLFANYSKMIKGVGRSETKAYISALRNIKVQDPSIARFVAEGKQKIIEYYISECGSILKEADMMANQRNYERALYMLVGIPAATGNCYNRAADRAAAIYKIKIKNECEMNLSNSKVAMNNGNWIQAIALLSGYTSDMPCYDKSRALMKEIQDARYASYLGKAKAYWADRDSRTAAYYLAKIPINSNYNTEAQQLISEIGSNLDEKAERDWKIEYNKSLHEEKSKKADSRNSRQWYQFIAVRNIATSYGMHQQTQIVYNTSSWW